MFGRFTKRAQRVLHLAREEAQRMNYPYVGTEHLLLGLIREGEGVAARVLADLGIDADKVRAAVAQMVEPAEAQGILEVTLTPRAKRVLELAIDEARRLGHNYVGTEHLLLGLIREGEGVAAQVLAGMGADLERTREKVLQLLGGVTAGGPAAMGAGPRGKATPTLNQFGRDLTQLAKEGKLDPVVGREKEIERVVQILSRRTKNNPVLIGDPGVGKTRGEG